MQPVLTTEHHFGFIQVSEGVLRQSWIPSNPSKILENATAPQAHKSRIERYCHVNNKQLPPQPLFNIVVDVEDRVTLADYRAVR